jgi:hypothetical protein
MIDVETEGPSLALLEMMGLEKCKRMWVWSGHWLCTLVCKLNPRAGCTSLELGS